MLVLNMTVTFDGGEKSDLVCTTPDFIEFESHFDKPFSALQEQPRLTYLLFLAWSAASRTEITDKPFKEWTATVTNVEADSPKA